MSSPESSLDLRLIRPSTPLHDQNLNDLFERFNITGSDIESKGSQSGDKDLNQLLDLLDESSQELKPDLVDSIRNVLEHEKEEELHNIKLELYRQKEEDISKLRAEVSEVESYSGANLRKLLIPLFNEIPDSRWQCYSIQELVDMIKDDKEARDADVRRIQHSKADLQTDYDSLLLKYSHVSQELENVKNNCKLLEHEKINLFHEKTNLENILSNLKTESCASAESYACLVNKLRQEHSETLEKLRLNNEKSSLALKEDLENRYKISLHDFKDRCKKMYNDHVSDVTNAYKNILEDREKQQKVLESTQKELENLRKSSRESILSLKQNYIDALSKMKNNLAESKKRNLCKLEMEWSKRKEKYDEFWEKR